VINTKKTILIVEDDDSLRELVQSRLEKEGFEVVTAADGFQAVVTGRQAQLDLVILDLILPKMDGYSVCQLLKSGGLAKTPIIILSARSSPEDVRRGLDMGASAYLTKPYDAAVLLDKVRELLFPKEWAKEREAAPKVEEPPPAAEPPKAAETPKAEPEVAERRTREEA
jgi:two-component system OmpR family response regulator